MEENKNIPPKQSPENIQEVEHSESPTLNEETISSEENILTLNIIMNKIEKKNCGVRKSEVTFINNRRQGR